MLAQHLSRFEADGVDDEVGVDVLGVDVRGDDHLVLRPRPRRELLCDLVRLLRRHVLLWGERLRVVIEPAVAVLVVDLARGEELLLGELRRAVLPADEASLHGLVVALDVANRAAHRAAGLFAVFDEIDRRHHWFSCSASLRTARNRRPSFS